jgi:hypothetical protein
MDYQQQGPLEPATDAAQGKGKVEPSPLVTLTVMTLTTVTIRMGTILALVT